MFEQEGIVPEKAEQNLLLRKTRTTLCSINSANCCKSNFENHGR